MSEPAKGAHSHIDPRRVTEIRHGRRGEGPVVYWMSRDQRAEDNWALLFARTMAREWRRPCVVLFCLTPSYPEAVWRHYDFMLTGLEEAESTLRRRGTPLLLEIGHPPTLVPKFVERIDAACVVTDFDPLRVKRRWVGDTAAKLNVPMWEVDAHNIVPCRWVSKKQEYAARTIRPKIHKVLDEFLVDFPATLSRKHPVDSPEIPAVDWKRARRAVKSDRNVGPVDAFAPGTSAAKRRLRAFLSDGLHRYADTSNDPCADSVSRLSPYFHFGQLAPQTVALAAVDSDAAPENREAFLEELIVRRELSDNFCFYRPNYDSPACFDGWARKTLDEHRGDPRDYEYDRDEFEAADTHDELWNAAQRCLVDDGFLHGYVRMYWAKKILEWSESPEAAMETALYLNNRYLLDGREPNGYVGVAWSIGGIHDRAWSERPVFGKIRYMVTLRHETEVRRRGEFIPASLAADRIGALRLGHELPGNLDREPGSLRSAC